MASLFNGKSNLLGYLFGYLLKFPATCFLKHSKRLSDKSIYYNYLKQEVMNLCIKNMNYVIWQNIWK